MDYKKIKKICLDNISNRITSKNYWNEKTFSFKLFSLKENNLIKCNYLIALESELLLIENNVIDSCFILTTHRLLFYNENQWNKINISEIIDFTEEFILCDELNDMQFEFIEAEIELLNHRKISLKIKNGTPVMIFINCLNQLLRYY